MNMKSSGLAAALAGLALAASVAQAQVQTVPPVMPSNALSPEATLRRNLHDRIPNIGRIDEINRFKEVPGLWEIRIGTEIFYSDAEGNYLINGQIIDTRNKVNITEQRLDKLLAIDFDSLPVKDAFTIVRGNGKRKLAVFEDPNCGYCKRFERDLQKVDNVTIHMFLYPILGPDSTEKSRNIWCARDKTRAWLDWMVRDQAAPKADGSCDMAALNRNIEFGKKHKITGTPTLVFADGSRVPGAIGAADVEKMLAGK
jgi:thiol:disulfide interchange protein DsbC